MIFAINEHAHKLTAAVKTARQDYCWTLMFDAHFILALGKQNNKKKKTQNKTKQKQKKKKKKKKIEIKEKKTKLVEIKFSNTHCKYTVLAHKNSNC